MEDIQKYEELRVFFGSPLWLEVLRPRLADWAKRKESGLAAAKTPAELWDAREVSKTAAEVLPLFDSMIPELRKKLTKEDMPPPQASA